MNRKLGLLIAVLLIAVQTFTVWHMAEHAFCKHSHNGKPCEIGDFYAQGKIAASEFILKPPAQVFCIVRNILGNNLTARSIVYSISNPRAPPIGLFSA